MLDFVLCDAIPQNYHDNNNHISPVKTCAGALPKSTKPKARKNPKIVALTAHINHNLSFLPEISRKNTKTKRETQNLRGHKVERQNLGVISATRRAAGVLQFARTTSDDLWLLCREIRHQFDRNFAQSLKVRD